MGREGAEGVEDGIGNDLREGKGRERAHGLGRLEGLGEWAGIELRERRMKPEWS